jgi:hypothetical protein
VLFLPLNALPKLRLLYQTMNEQHSRHKKVRKKPFLFLSGVYICTFPLMYIHWKIVMMISKSSKRRMQITGHQNWYMI